MLSPKIEAPAARYSGDKSESAKRCPYFGANSSGTHGFHRYQHQTQKACITLETKLKSANVTTGSISGWFSRAHRLRPNMTPNAGTNNNFSSQTLRPSGLNHSFQSRERRFRRKMSR